jgi:hypothetical protein
MKCFLPILSFLSFYVSPAFAQRETDHWLFGNQAGLSFRDNISTPFLGSKLHQPEGSAVVSDRKTGQLLFYTDGLHIWNRQNEVMQGGSDLLGSSTSTQSALIVPAPGTSHRYYVFTVKAYNNGPKPGLHYSNVDMKLNDGLGAVVNETKNRLLEASTTEKLTAIPHANGQDYWVLAHIWDSDEFLIMKLTAQGISIKKRQRIGTVHQAGIRVKNSEAMGYLKASPDGKRVASAVYGQERPFELYDFDAQTGELSNYRSLGNFSYQYGVSFSPDNTKLYLSGLYSFHDSYQFDLATPNYAVTKLTLVDTLRGQPYLSSLSGALQLGIDGKLYSAGRSPLRSHPLRGQIAVISEPNAAGTECRVGYHPTAYKGGTPLLGLPNFIQSVFNQHPETKSELAPDLVNVYPNPVFQNKLTIEPLLSDYPIEGFVVYDQAGRIMTRHDEPVAARLVMDTSSWGNAGTYEVVFKCRNRAVSKKIFKH